MQSFYRDEQPAPTPPQLLLDVKTASRALSICPKTLFTLTRRGDIKCVHIGHRVLYSPGSLTAYINQQETQQASNLVGGA